MHGDSSLYLKIQRGARHEYLGNLYLLIWFEWEPLYARGPCPVHGPQEPPILKTPSLCVTAIEGVAGWGIVYCSVIVVLGTHAHTCMCTNLLRMLSLPYTFNSHMYGNVSTQCCSWYNYGKGSYTRKTIYGKGFMLNGSISLASASSLKKTNY